MSFRKILRDGTRPEHDQLDAMFTALDIAKRDDFVLFIQVHLLCFQAMSEAASTSDYAQLILHQMVDRLALDLDVLEAKPPKTVVTPPDVSDPLATDYMVAGSRLGSKVLKRRWATSQDPIVCRASNYFSLEVNATFWPATCDALAEVPPESARADVIVQDSQALFQLFSNVYQSTKTREAAAL